MTNGKSTIVVLTVLVCSLVMWGFQGGTNGQGKPAEQRFRFTVTACPHEAHVEFGETLAAINKLTGGPGVFHITVGDLAGFHPDSIELNRVEINTHFGGSTIWYPVVGNHDMEEAHDMVWLRGEYNNGNGRRTPLKNFTNQDGPATSKETTYSWDHGDAHFAVLNVYWDGKKDAAYFDGRAGKALLAWLVRDLDANTKPYVFVIAHEPAYPRPEPGMAGHALDSHPKDRDVLWDLLEAKGVTAYICGHQHFSSIYRRPGGSVWQITAGSAGIETMLTRQGSQGRHTSSFLSITVASEAVVAEVYRLDKKTGRWKSSNVVKCYSKRGTAEQRIKVSGESR